MTICKFNIKGMVNKVDPSCIPYDVSRGFKQELAVSAVNCDMKTPYGFRRRKGYANLDNTACHSGWSNGTDSYLIRDSVLYHFDGSSIVPIYQLSSNEYGAFCDVLGMVVFTNTTDYLILEGISVTTPQYSTEDFKCAPSPGSDLCFYNGRVYISVDNRIECTDTFSVDTCDSRRIVVAQYPCVVTFVKSVKNGLFVGTEKGVYFLSGSDPFSDESFSMDKKNNYYGIAGTALEVNGDKVKIAGTSGEVVIFATSNGICVGKNDGTIVDLTSEIISYDHGERGCAYLKEEEGETYYVVSFPQNFSEKNVYVGPSFTIDEQEL